jgi:hypothetical protein
MPRTRRDDIDELHHAIAEVPEGGQLVHALEVALNCIQNLADELEKAEARIARLERDR